MSFTDTILVRLLIRYLRKVDKNMSDISDKITAGNASLDSLVGAVQKLGDDQAKAFADLKAKIAAGGVTADDLANMDSLISKAQNIGTSIATLDSAAVDADK